MDSKSDEWGDHEDVAEIQKDSLETEATIPCVDSDSSIYVSKEGMMLQENHASQAVVEKLNAEIVQLKSLLAKRDNEILILESKEQKTKDEAEKRIGEAKEKQSEMEELIHDLRSELREYRKSTLIIL